MCATCGCGGDGVTITSLAHTGHGHGHGREHPHIESRTVQLEQDVLAKNDQLAEGNRSWLRARQIRAVNLMSSPGAGKTTVLERTVAELGAHTSVSVIEGDQETLMDAQRITATGARAIQVNTGAGCHLDAEMLAGALQTLDPPERSVLFIENVGNLVCPALFDLGESSRVVIMSVTEGEDKPLKYPHMFRTANLLLLNKIDLLPYLRFDVDSCVANARRVRPALEVLRISATTGEGMADWYAWLGAERT